MNKVRWLQPKTLIVVLLLAALLSLPHVIQQQYFIHTVNLALLYCILALGLQLVIGYAGQFSIGHIVFFGAGAYTAAVMTHDFGMPFLVGLAAAMLVAGLCGAVLAPITRLRGNYMAVATLAFLQIGHMVFLNWVPVTRGALGFLNIPSASIGPIVLAGETPYYYVVLVALALTYVAFTRLVSIETRFGRALAAIRQNELAASSLGINPTSYKVTVFIVSAASAGIAGSLFAHFLGYLNPNDFLLENQINLVLMIVVGGLGSLQGAVLGAILLTFAPEYLRALKDFRYIIYGLLIVIMMIVLPGGLAGLYGATRDWIVGRRWRPGLKEIESQEQMAEPEMEPGR